MLRNWTWHNFSEARLQRSNGSLNVVVFDPKQTIERMRADG